VSASSTPTRLTLADMKHLYETRGWSVAKVARASFRSPTTTRRMLRAAGADLRPRGGVELQLSQADVRHTIDLYHRVGAREAARTLGLAHPQTVRARLRTAGEPRTQAGRRPPRPVPAGFETTTELAQRERITPRAARLRASSGRIAGAYQEATYPHRWMVPVTTKETP
jgi:transposase-like protein